MTSTNAYANQKCASSHYLPFLTIVEPNHHRATTLSHPADYHEQSIEIGLNQAIQSPITRTHNLLQHRCTRCIHSSDMQRNKEPAVLTGLSSFDASLPHLPEEFENHSTGSRNNSAILVPHARNKHLRSPPSACERIAACQLDPATPQRSKKLGGMSNAHPAQREIVRRSHAPLTNHISDRDAWQPRGTGQQLRQFRPRRPVRQHPYRSSPAEAQATAWSRGSEQESRAWPTGSESAPERS